MSRRAADDRVVRIDAERREEGVHRAAQAAVEAGVAGEDLGQRAVDDEIDRQVLRRSRGILLDDAQAVAAEVVAHDRMQRLVVELVDGREALGQDLAVGAVRAEDVVVGVEQVRLADRRRFLADREVRRAAVVVRDVLVSAPAS